MKGQLAEGQLEESLEDKIENILDTQYRTFSSGINAPGRNIYAGLHYTF